ncbi:MAG TPA: alkaline phosphatase family protein, partial [Candidatus Krumholzibacteria bacterium]|nr:alkaline phosphatase family protein [Candidatus Krumholzibacteria bacterium]
MRGSRSDLRLSPSSLVLLLLAALLCARAVAAHAQEKAPHPRVIVLGFDGVDPDRCREYFEKNDLPHLSKLAQEGTFSDLATTYPAQSPVSWASFVTGQ